jgi:hypothetical protein
MLQFSYFSSVRPGKLEHRSLHLPPTAPTDLQFFWACCSALYNLYSWYIVLKLCILSCCSWATIPVPTRCRGSFLVFEGGRNVKLNVQLLLTITRSSAFRPPVRRLRAGWPEFYSRQGQRICFSSPPRSDRLWGLPLLSSGHRVLFPRG